MIGRKSLARTSSKPGKTQTLNFYKIEEQLFFVDVPGYGYAKVSKSSRETWGKLIQQYLTEREHLRAVIQIVDLRHPPTADDCNMYDFLVNYNIPAIVIATKADKIPRGKWEKHKKIVRETLEYATMTIHLSSFHLKKELVWRKHGEKLKAECNSK